MPEAMKLIRSDLGNDAIILNSKVIYTGGFLGFFRKKNIEVIAAVDQAPQMEPRVQEKQRKVPPTAPIKQMIIEKAPKETAVKKETVKEKTSPEILNELSAMKQMLENLSPAGQAALSYPEPIRKVNALLEKQDIDQQMRQTLCMSLIERWYARGANASFTTVLAWCKELMIERIAHLSYGELSFSKKFINVVGPTGVGKTTTLAKIAADCTLKFNKKVAFITTDTYRIAAIDQLKTYAKILSIPLEVCYNLDDFHKACESFKSYDVILIDTAGRNFRNEQYVEELKKTIDFTNEMETFLVLSLTAKQRDMEEIYEQFSKIDINQFIFTKMDETSSYGAMYNMIVKYDKGVAYVTNGQNVPDDRISASVDEIMNMVLGVGEQ